MKEEKKESPIGVLWGWGKPYHGKFIGSIILAVLGVACQMVPYFCVAHIVTMMLSGEQNFSRYVTAGIIALCGYFGKVLFSCLSTTISHTATYYTLRDLRENITAKLARVPMGTILDTPSGQYKTTIVDRVEGMESTFAHLIPEMTANVLVPLVIVVYLFLMDWRMALLSLVTLVVGLAVMSAGMKNYPVKWEGAVKAGKQMTDAIVEYIGGIEVVKAFSQSAGSYKKYSDAVNYNANYYVDWMRENQKTMSAYNAISITRDTKRISIHAPREGERLSEVRGLRVCDIFQSTLPARWSDHANAQRVRARKISIHAPREGERLCRHAKTRAYLYHFNPRSPRGGATVDAQFKLLGKKNFNPRSPRGGATRRELNGLVL